MKKQCIVLEGRSHPKQKTTQKPLQCRMLKALYKVPKFILRKNIRSYYLPPMMKFEIFEFLFEIKDPTIATRSYETKNEPPQNRGKFFTFTS